MKADFKIFGSLAAAAVFLHVTGIGCPLRWMTGIPCAGCGMSRAVLALLHGHVREAASMHPLVFLLPPAAAAWLLWRLHPGLIPRRFMRAAAVSAAAAFLIVYAVRITKGDTILQADLSQGILFRSIKEVCYVLSKLR